ncbi:hypothetical protein [Shewanella algae]|uniref:hypothetical protein n=1 Tax=Shewanella algae TaxID=38313 RepID=UPI0005CD48B1|nr:hypothetical protein [Shewanella algae]MBO2671178.1 hypothetical protein [Shewanella algae]
MQISELLQLSFWIDENIKNTQIAQKYQALQAGIQQNVNARNNQPKQPFKSQKDSLIETIKVLSTKGLTYQQEDILSQLNITQNIGENGVARVERILYENSLDVATAAAEISKITQEIAAAIQKSDQIKAAIKPLIPTSEEDDKEAGSVIMRVHFQNEVGMDNVTDFKKLGNYWWEIGRGIAMAHDCAPEDIKVVGASKGSIIIDLAVAAAIATTTSTIILSALKVADRVLTIRKKVEEIKSLKLNNQKLEIDLAKEAEREKKEGLDKITIKIAKNLKIETNGDGEKIKVLEKSVKNLIDFVEKGGEVDFFTENSSEDEPEIKLLKHNFDEIKKLEKRVLMLESKD